MQHAALAIALMVASGFAALGYQIVWTQQARCGWATKRQPCSPWWPLSSADWP
jgi:hypothetical protein